MLSADELAGVVDLFGALSRPELSEALSELAYRRGEDPPEEIVEDAVAAFALVGFVDDGHRLFAPGPAAFPTLPEGAEDLPHILDQQPRSVDRAAVAEAAADRLRTEAACAATLGATDRAERLVDISYDLETWAAIDLSGVRSRLDATLDGTN